MILIRQVLLPAAILLAGCHPAANPPATNPAANSQSPPRTADADKAVTRARLERIGKEVRPLTELRAGVPMYYARSTNTLGLSWRVGLLPSVGEKALYEKFNLDQPWDSEHNKPLIEQMPELLKSPRGGAPTGHTFYRTFVSLPTSKSRWHTAYPPLLTTKEVEGRYKYSLPAGLPLSFAAQTTIVDGSINTLFFVEAVEAVPWTKPDELAYDEAAPLPKLGGVYDDGFFAVSMAGVVVFVPKGTDEKTIRALITSNANDPITDQGILDQLNAPFPRQPGPPAKTDKP
jgi:hypothetical protein